MDRHPTVTLVGPSGSVEIDVALAPLIEVLWLLGITTQQCCQHDPLSDSAEISFPTSAHAARFVHAVFLIVDERDSMQTRLRDWEVLDPCPSSARDGWRWVAVPEPTDDGWDFAVLVQFPVQDIAEVVDRLRRNYPI